MENKLLSYNLGLLLAVLLSGCSSTDTDPLRGATVVDDDPFGDNIEKVAYLPQGWDAEDSEWFYTTTQGSNLLSYWVYLNLEDTKSNNEKQELLRSERNTRRFRYLVQSKTPNNPDGLPLGFVKDVYKDQEYIGFTCAACHTTQVNYQGVGLRIDGGPTLANMPLFLSELEESLKSTIDDKQKLQRLAKRANKTIDETKEQVTKDYNTIQSYNLTNSSEHNGQEVHYGYARLDAFGRIFNQVLTHLTPEDKNNFNSPNAPVSYPFLWDTPYHDFVQWNGIGDNGSSTLGLRLGPLGRNVGEVLGVFANFSLEPGEQQFVSSADKINLEQLEIRLQSLWSPTWDDAAANSGLPPINKELARQGEQVYKDYQCRACHEDLNHQERTNPKRQITAQFTSVEFLQTDAQMINNAATYCGQSGFFTNDGIGMCGANPNEVPVASALSKAVSKVLLKGDPDESWFRRLLHTGELLVSATKNNPVGDDTKRHVNLEVSNRSNLMAYKARPLNGIWATAPYLHNGSVANLNELFMPTCKNIKDPTVKPEPSVNCRSEKFTVGSRELDPAKVGFVQKSKANYPELFEFDTTLPGNFNGGHEYTSGITPMIKLVNNKVLKDEKGNPQKIWFDPITPDQRKALIEYVKSL